MTKSALLGLALGTCTILAACGSSSSPGAKGAAGAGGAAGDTSAAGTTGSGGSGVGPSGGTTGTADAAVSVPGCPTSALTILFNPMYSAFDGVHTFQLPAVVNGIDPSMVDIEWSAADPDMVALEPDPTTGGVMITMQKAGTTSIIVTANGQCGVAPLSITEATPDDWMAGSDRYNNGIVLNRLPIGMGNRRDAGTDAGDGGLDVKCTDCHGDTATMGPFKTVQHTPEQTGGFSDDDLLNIIQNGTVPKGGYFDTMVVPYNVWQAFHRWDLGDSPKGLITYLRSLTPAAQTGVPNFNGRFDGGARDGGFDGNFFRPEGGREAGGREAGFGRRDAAQGQ
jgi:hypothetical protein